MGEDRYGFVGEGSRIHVINGKAPACGSGVNRATGYSPAIHSTNKVPTCERCLSMIKMSDLLGIVADTMPELLRIAKAIRKVGGRAVLVGGSVRDLSEGRAPKDADVEVYGLGADRLEAVLRTFGTVALAGKSFGVIKLRTPAGGDYDFSLPRRENKIGTGHKGFMVQPDPGMTPREAALRRDFTWNAMALDLGTGKLMDFFGGKDDLDNRLIRATSAHFAEDALRVLRGMQFAARMDLRMADAVTARLCREMRAEYESLARERVWGEWEKWAVKGTRPGRGIEFLQAAGWLDLYPEINGLRGVPQDAVWHPEGDALHHTMIATDRAAQIADRDGLKDSERAILVFAALLHDAAKPETTVIDGGRIKSPGHAAAGGEKARRFMRSIGAPTEMGEAVANLVEGHMDHLNAHTPASVRRLALRMQPTTIRQLLRIIEADHSARPPLPAGLPAQAAALKSLAEDARVIDGPVASILLGRHLLARGMRPGPQMGRILKAAFEAQLDGHFGDIEGAQRWLDRHMAA